MVLMNTLGIDTTSRVSSVAVSRDGRIVCFDLLGDATQNHAETILLLVQKCLNRAALTLADIDAFSAAIGPGSFTGLRIALATAKGLAMAGGKPLADVSSLLAMAFSYVHQNGPASDVVIAPCIDARKDEIYGAAYLLLADGSLKELLAEGIFSPADFASRLAETEKHTTLIGSGALRYAEILESKERGRIVYTVPVPSAIGVAMLGAEKIAKNNVQPISVLIPNYLRKADAEIKKNI